jgi:hypothetical protein
VLPRIDHSYISMFRHLRKACSAMAGLSAVLAAAVSAIQSLDATFSTNDVIVVKSMACISTLMATRQEALALDIAATS